MHRSGCGPGRSIQGAINRVPTDSTVCVGPGTYWENLLISKDGITLEGAGPEKTERTGSI
jgi:hypothetical protein